MADKNVPLRETDEEKLNDPELVNSVADRLSVLTDEPVEDLEDDPIEPEGGPVDPEPESDPAEPEDLTDPAPTPDDQAAESESADGPTPESGIPDAYYRSAVRFGWKAEDVDEMYAKDPKYMMTLLQNLHQKDNSVTAYMAKMGRRAKELESTQENGTSRAPDLTQNTPAAKPPVDLEALRASHPDDPLVDLYATQAEQMAAMQQTMDQLNDQLRQTRTQSNQQEADQQVTLMRHVNGFFGGDSMSPYAKFYGVVDKDATNWDGLSTAQADNRDRVCTLADQIIAGAQLLGDSITLEDAMEQAHSVVSEPIAESIMRAKIMGDVEKRHKSRVVRPSKSASTSSSRKTGGKPANRKELLARTHERLVKILPRS